LALSVTVGLLMSPVAARADAVIVTCGGSCAAVAQAIKDHGGRITYQYRYIDAIAADLSDAALAAVRTLVEPGAVRKDVIVAAPTVARDRDGSRMVADAEAETASVMATGELVSLSTTSPGAYLINNDSLNLGALHGSGFVGTGMKVAVIDSGIRPGFPHIDLDGSVIGGEDLVGDALGYSNFANGGHGTFVAGMISANVIFTFGATSGLLNAVKTYCPGCVTGASANRIPMIGSAPLSSIYALRVFGPSGGAPESRIIAAMERVIELKENYDNGIPESQNPDGSYTSLNVAVCNMSLGGPTLYAGRDLEDQLTNAFLDHDIVLVVAASNAGPSGSTGGSPGTGFGALTVGATSSAVHERILRDVQYGAGIGALFRPFSGTQTAYFSSRGPTADGRVDPDVVANGFASYGQGFALTVNGISIGSGTSFASPTVAGVAAVLKEAYPGATARQIRNALIESASAAVVADGSGPLDIGAGYVDAAAASTLLQSWVADTPGAAGGTNVNVKVNIRQGAGVKTFDGNVTRTASGLLPGQRFETFYRVTPNTAAVVISLSNVTPGAVENVFFGDDILLAVHSAKTSGIGEGDYPVFGFATGGTFVVPNPEQGLMRVTLSGDWTNASPIDATVNIFSVADPLPGLTTQHKVSDGDLQFVPFTVAAGASSLDVRLEWDGDWSSYPANDLDVILIDPNGGLDYSAATLDSPERTTIDNPIAGNWVAVVSGYSIATKNGDRYKLRIVVDGVVVK